MKKTAFLVLLAFISNSAISQTKSVKSSPPLVEAAPTSVGMSDERLARIDNMLKEAIDKNEIPGAVALIARNGKIVYYKSFGTADSETNRKLKRDDIFRIASQTKAITSTAVMMLWEEGKFGLDDPISKYIPEFAKVQLLDSMMVRDSSFITIPAKNPITIRHLLTHTSGIGYGFIDDDRFKKIYWKAGIKEAFCAQPVMNEKNIKKLATLPLHHNPGEKWTYSMGLDVLGYLVEIVSGKPLDVFFKERIFTPLGMNDTYFYLPKSKANRLVSVQTKKDEKWVRYADTTAYNPQYPVKGSRTLFSGGGGLSSTATDYAAFLQMYLNNGELNGLRLLSRTSVQFIMANQIKELWGSSGAYYGLAFEVINQEGQAMGGRGSAGTFGWGGYFDTQYFADPKEKVIGILLKQLTDVHTDDTTGWKFRQLVGQAIDD